ncbi:MAG: type II toxin-antitoxin system RelE/ParE family toxin [Methanomicrobiales archaeon]|nr:type II toxin-antitoxin system RelE/ParE family toxin [Methanomicrobiales archaeon]
MPYTVIWTEKALENLKQLPRKTATRIVVAVEKIRDNPPGHLQLLRGSPYFKLRAGNYRAPASPGEG